MSNSKAQYEPLVLYRLLFGDTNEYGPIFNGIIDADMFDNRVIITDSRSFTLGKDDPFLHILTTLPGTCTILDFADKVPAQDASRFILGDSKYLDVEDAIVQKDLDTFIAKSIERKDWDAVEDNVTAMLFLFETKFIVADFGCRFIKDDYFDIKHRLYTLASLNSSNLLIQFSDDQLLLGNLSCNALASNVAFYLSTRERVIKFCAAMEGPKKLTTDILQSLPGMRFESNQAMRVII